MHDPNLTAVETELMLLLEQLTKGTVSRLELRQIARDFARLLPRLLKGQ